MTVENLEDIMIEWGRIREKYELTECAEDKEPSDELKEMYQEEIEECLANLPDDYLLGMFMDAFAVWVQRESVPPGLSKAALEEMQKMHQHQLLHAIFGKLGESFKNGEMINLPGNLGVVIVEKEGK